MGQQPIDDLEAYRTQLRARLNPTTSVLTLAYEAARANPKRVVFAEGEDDRVLRAAQVMSEDSTDRAILIGRPEVIAQRIDRAGLSAVSLAACARSSRATRRYSSVLASISACAASGIASTAARSLTGAGPSRRD